MAKDWKDSLSPESAVSSTLPLSEAPQDILGPFNLSSPEYLYDHIEAERDFQCIFTHILREIEVSLRNCDYESLVKTVVANDNCPLIVVDGDAPRKTLSRDLEFTAEPAQEVEVVLDPAGTRPLHATVRYNGTSLCDRTITIKLEYDPNGELERRHILIEIPESEDKQLVVISLTENCQNLFFSEQDGLLKSRWATYGELRAADNLESKLTLSPSCPRRAKVIHTMRREIRDSQSGEILFEDSKSVPQRVG